MEKDDLSGWFGTLIEAGLKIVVQRPQSGRLEGRLINAGFGLYDTLDRSAVTDGRLASMISQFHGQAAYYAVRRSTTSRRVANSLSTRFATALCASAPIVAPPQAAFARELFEATRIGTCEVDAEKIRLTLEVEQELMRKRWSEDHLKWAGESFVNLAADAWRH